MGEGAFHTPGGISLYLLERQLSQQRFGHSREAGWALKLGARMGGLGAGGPRAAFVNMSFLFPTLLSFSLTLGVPDRQGKSLPFPSFWECCPGLVLSTGQSVPPTSLSPTGSPLRGCHGPVPSPALSPPCFSLTICSCSKCRGEAGTFLLFCRVSISQPLSRPLGEKMTSPR